MPNKRQIIRSIVAVAKELGHTPSRTEFLGHCRISLYFVQQSFGSWNKAVRAAGLCPYKLNARLEDRALLEDWGKIARRNRAVLPWRIYLRDGKYSPGALAKRFGGWSAVPEAFRHFAKGKREWADVLALLPARGRGSVIAKARRERTFSNTPLAFAPSRKLSALLKDRRIYGNPTPFPWLRHEPVNEQGVVLLFGMLAKDLGYVVENVHKDFPDCEAKRQVAADRWQRVQIEFEFESKNYRDHGHPPDGCDVIVCWRHNWSACPKHIEVVELASVMKSLAGELV